MPKSPTKQQLTRLLENARLEAEIARHRLDTQLSESLYAPLDLVNPLEQFFDGHKPFLPLYPSRWDSRQFNSGIWVSEAQLDLIRFTSRWLYDTNQTAKAMVGSLENYVIKSGYDYRVTGRGTKDDKSARVKRVQRFVDDFLTYNRFFERELDLFRRSRRDGEFFVRLFASEDGITKVRIIEPEQVRPKDGSPQWYFGIEVEPDDRESVLGYWCCYDGTIANGEYAEASEVVHYKINVDLIIKRGLPDFFCTQDHLISTAKLLKATVMGESVRQAIAYVRQHAQASKATMQSIQSGNTDYQLPVPTNNGMVRLQPVQRVEPGSVTDIPQGLEFLGGPVGNGQNAQLALQAAYQSLSAYAQMPSWMLSGDSGGVNFASAIVHESPFVRRCEKEQKLYSNAFKEIIKKALDIAVIQGVLSETDIEETEVTVHCPPVVVRNAKEETDRNKLLADAKLLSPRTWSDREELDFDHEQEQISLDPPVTAAPSDLANQRSTTPNAEYQRQTNRPE